MKKLVVVLAILFIGILLAGCTSQPAKPVATPVPTTVATPVPTTVVTTVAPTPEPTKVVVVVVENKTATPTPTPTVQPSVTITFTQDMTIIPDINANIPVGGKVVWVNKDPFKPHTIIATDMQDGAWFGGMTSTTIPAGGSYEVTFTKAGAYDYKSVFQPEADGVIRVK